jgi:methionyl-tRNA formyltransferase
MKILFMGTPAFALPSLKRLYEEFQLIGVITQHDKPAGRGQKLTPPPVKLLAQELSLEVFQPQKKSELLPILERLKPDCIVVVAYGKILPPEVIKFPRYGCINLHASLLPKYRGSAPIQRALMSGEKTTGNSIMLMDEGMDTGPLLAQEEVFIEEEDNLQTLSEKLSKSGAELLIKTLKSWFEGRLVPKPQEGETTYAPPVEKEEYRICWKASAESIKDRIRGLYPDCYTFTDRGERLKLMKVKVVQAEGEPGEIIDRKNFIVACGEKALQVLELISPKGKRVKGQDFLRGYPLERLF